jgi:hypothetical protein
MTTPRRDGKAVLAVLPRAVGLRFSLVTLAAIARDLARSGYRGTGAWTGVVRQCRRYAAELRLERGRRTEAVRERGSP